MSIDPLFTSLAVTLIPAIKDILGEWLFKRAPLTETDSGRKLERLDRRISLGIAKRSGKHLLALMVEKKDSWAEQKAEELGSAYAKTVVVEVTGKAFASNPDNKVKVTHRGKLTPGISIGHFRGYAGTLSGFVQVSGEARIIGSSHVLSMINTGEKGEDIIHPGWPDGARVFKNRIGTLEDYTYLVHHQQKEDPLNSEDIAVVKPVNPDSIPSRNLVINPKDQKRKIKLKGCIPSDSLFERIGEPVYKDGRTSGFTAGTLEVTNIAQFSVELPNGRVYIFTNVAAVKSGSRRSFSGPGDSGSIVYTGDGQAIGLILGASSTHSIVIPLSTCLKAIDAELI